MPCRRDLENPPGKAKNLYSFLFDFQALSTDNRQTITGATNRGRISSDRGTAGNVTVKMHTGILSKRCTVYLQISRFYSRKNFFHYPELRSAAFRIFLRIWNLLGEQLCCSKLSTKLLTESQTGNFLHPQEAFVPFAGEL